MAKRKNPPEEQDLRIEAMPLAKLKTAPRNPKRHSHNDIDLSMSRFGFVAPPIINEKTGTLVAGHGRVETLIKRKAAGEPPPDRVKEQDGDWLVPVMRGVSFATDEEAEAYLLADNRLTETGGWDSRGLALMLTNLSLQNDEAMAGVGYDVGDLDELLSDLRSANGALPPRHRKKPDGTGGEWLTEGGSEILGPSYKIVLKCRDEQHQADLLEQFENDGIECQALML